MASIPTGSRKRPRDPTTDSLQHDDTVPMIPLDDLYAAGLAEPPREATPNQDAIDQYSRAINLDPHLDAGTSRTDGASLPELRLPDDDLAHPHNGDTTFGSNMSDDMGDDRLDVPDGDKKFPFSRSPELRVSHKLAERKRRKEMKDLFDELRERLPSERGNKSSKYEILTRSIEYIDSLKQINGDKTRETERLRRDLDIARGGTGAGFAAPGPTYQSYPIGGFQSGNGFSQAGQTAGAQVAEKQAH